MRVFIFLIFIFAGTSIGLSEDRLEDDTLERINLHLTDLQNGHVTSETAGNEILSIIQQSKNKDIKSKRLEENITTVDLVIAGVCVKENFETKLERNISASISVFFREKNLLSKETNKTLDTFKRLVALNLYSGTCLTSFQFDD